MRGKGIFWAPGNQPLVNSVKHQELAVVAGTWLVN